MRRLIGDILTLAPQDRQPSLRTAAEFVDELTSDLLTRKSLALHPRDPERIDFQPQDRMTAAILDVLQGSRLPALQFRLAAGDFREALILLGVADAEADRAEDRLVRLGREIRGPEKRSL